MNHIKQVFTALTVVLSAVSCSEEMGDAPKGNLTINAVAGSLSDADQDTKSHGQYSYRMVWEENDRIAVVDGNGRQGLFNLVDGAGRSLGKFEQTEGDAVSSKVTGYYPSTLVLEDGTMSWPAVQKYSKDLTSIPMMATATVAEGGTDFEFESIGGVLQLLLSSGDREIKLKRIIISADYPGISGPFYFEDGYSKGFESGTTMTVDCDGLIIGPSAKPVNIALHEGNFTNLLLCFETEDNEKVGMSMNGLQINIGQITTVPVPLGDLGMPFPDYLHFKAVGSAVLIGLAKTGSPDPIEFEYTLNPFSGKWTDFIADESRDIISLAKDETIYLRAKFLKKGLSKDADNYWRFDFSDKYGNVEAGGNIMSLIDPEVKSVELGDYAFYELFGDCRTMLTAPSLPATKLGKYCYFRMFAGCRSLTDAPDLPAKKVSERCYSYMFYICTSLKNAPEIASYTLAPGCYNFMFSSCSSLEAAPELPVMNLEDRCYECMFENCIKLVHAPELPATEMTVACYRRMFYNCPRLIAAPELPAIKLAQSCYDYMFYGCKALTEAPYLPATDNVLFCYDHMFAGCSSLASARVDLLHFNGKSTESWLDGVSPTGIFYCPGNLKINERSASTVPAGWKVIRTSIPDEPVVGDRILDNGVEGMYVGKSGDERVVFAIKNFGADSIYDKGNRYYGSDLHRMIIFENPFPGKWELPSQYHMAVLGGLEFVNDAEHDGVYNSEYDFFIPYTQDVSDGLRESRLWISGINTYSFYWFRSDAKSGLTTEMTDALNYHVRLVRIY